MTRWTMIWVVLGALGAAVGCDDDDDDDRLGTGGTQATGGSAGTGGTLGGSGGTAAVDLTDGQVASVIRTANVGEIAQAQAALPSLVDDDAREFALEMIDDHGDANDLLETLLMTQNIVSVSNPLTIQLQQESNAVIEEIQNATDVDRVYIDSQVTVHERLLALLDDELIPDTENQVLRAYLQTTRDTVRDHLEDARDVQEDLAQGGAGGAGGAGGSAGSGGTTGGTGGTSGGTAGSGGTTGGTAGTGTTG